MQLIDSLVVLTLLGLAIGGAIGGAVTCAASPPFDGPLSAVGGALAGALGVPLVMIATVRVACFSVSVFTGRPYWPACTACGAVDFTYEVSSRPPIVRCACGRRYVRHGSQCRLVLPGGASQPHLRWHPLRGWVNEAPGPSTTPADLPYRDSSPASD